MFRSLCAFALLCALAAPAAAQTATVSGTITDQTGAAVPGATVALTGPGSPVSITSGPRGEGQLPRRRERPPPRHRDALGLRDHHTRPHRRRLERRGAGRSAHDRHPQRHRRRQREQVGDRADRRARDDERRHERGAGEHAGAELRRPAAVGAGRERHSALGARHQRHEPAGARRRSRNSQLVLLDGRSIYLDFFGLVLWDFLPDQPVRHQADRGRFAGPASAVWGANALTGVVNIITKSPREAPGTDGRRLSGGFFEPRRRIDGAARAPATLFGANATRRKAPNAAGRTACRPATSTPIRFRGRRAGFRVITDPRDPTRRRSAARRTRRTATGALGTAFQNRGTSQPKFDARVDQEIDGEAA